MTGAIAVFVKTPKLSPVKTRLAASIGEEKALEFYHLAVDAVKERIESAKDQMQGELEPYFAVAEKDGCNHDLWRSFKAIHTGEGGLGERMYNIYQGLLSKYGFVLLVGADSPQLSPDVILKAAKQLSENKGIVIGPASDGGFYLFGGNTPVPKDIWINVPYSQNNTLEILLNNINNLCDVSFLDTYTDVDEVDDLELILKEMPFDLSKTQAKLKEWILK